MANGVRHAVRLISIYNECSEVVILMVRIKGARVASRDCWVRVLGV